MMMYVMHSSIVIVAWIGQKMTVGREFFMY